MEENKHRNRIVAERAGFTLRTKGNTVAQKSPLLFSYSFLPFSCWVPQSRLTPVLFIFTPTTSLRLQLIFRYQETGWEPSPAPSPDKAPPLHLSQANRHLGGGHTPAPLTAYRAKQKGELSISKHNEIQCFLAVYQDLHTQLRLSPE